MELRPGCDACSDRLRVDTKEHPVMMAEANFQPRKAREKAVELLFEKFQPPAVFLAKNAVLTSFASGRQTSMVVDMGYEGSVGTPPPPIPPHPTPPHLPGDMHDLMQC